MVARGAAVEQVVDGGNAGRDPGRPQNHPHGRAGAGALILLTIPVTLWKARRTGGSRRRRYLRRGLTITAAPIVVLALLWLLIIPIGFGYIYTHTGRTTVTPELGVPYERVTVATSDSLDLTASYVPSKNRAAVILFPGATRSDEARMLIRHGYGVLLLDPRGQGASEGDTVRWAGDRDLLAGLEYVRSGPTSIRAASAHSASRSAARSCSRPRPSRPASKPSSPRARAFASARPTSPGATGSWFRRSCPC